MACGRFVSGVLGCLGAAVPALAADRVVRMVTPPPIGSSLDAMPQIADPADAAERRINAAVARFDTAVRTAVAKCRGLNGGKGEWERTVQTPMHGPGYITFVIVDSLYCGGAHPDNGLVSAIVYDLRTGSPIDWQQVLPPSLIGKVALSPSADGTKMISLASPALAALYTANYPTSQDDDCRAAVREGVGADTGMTVWLEAGQGLVLNPGLPHGVKACEEQVIVSTDALGAAGASPGLVASLQAARGR